MDIFVVAESIRLNTTSDLNLLPGVYQNNELYLVRLERAGLERPDSDPALTFREHGDWYCMWRDNVWRAATFDAKIALANVRGIMAANGYEHYVGIVNLIKSCAMNRNNPYGWQTMWRTLHRVNWP